MIHREVVLPLDCLQLGAAAVGVSLPVVLRPEPVWRNPDEQRVHHTGVRGVLAEQGLWRDGRPAEEFLGTMTLLGRAAHAFSATVETPGGPYRLHVAASGRDAVLACGVPSSGTVVLRPARAEALAEDLVRELPDVAPGPGPGWSVPESELLDAIRHGEPRRDVRRILDVVGLPRHGGGQIHAEYRDGLGGYRTTGDRCCTFYDTDHGRYLFSFSEETGGASCVTVVPGRADLVIGKAYDLLERLRRVR